MDKIFSIIFFSIITISGFSQAFQQPPTGPGSATYPHDSVSIFDYAQKQDGYWIFEPAAPKPKAANVIVFLHGYGGYNPMIYGQWIKHLVRQGNVIIYPRYQKNIAKPWPKKFSKNVVTAIQNAVAQLQKDQHISPILKDLCVVGHSYGGTIAADLSVNWEAYQIPEPKGVFLCAPGTGPFKAGKLDSYEAMSSTLNLLVFLNEKDHVVGDKLGIKIFETAIHTPNRNLLKQYTDSENDIGAGHNESYCVDLDFDSGVRNHTAKRALRISETNAVDYYGYWKLFDALIACTRKGKDCDTAFGNTLKQRSLGPLEGNTLLELEVKIPTEQPLLSEK